MQSPHYLWQRAGWPLLSFDTVRVAQALALARRAQGVVEGKLAVLGFHERQELAAEAWTQEAVSTAAIEGERLDLLDLPVLETVELDDLIAQRIAAAAGRRTILEEAVGDQTAMFVGGKELAVA